MNLHKEMEEKPPPGPGKGQNNREGFVELEK